MRTGDYTVMRYAVLIGYSGGRRIVSLATRERTLELALEAARRCRRMYPDALFWISKVGQKAYLPRTNP